MKRIYSIGILSILFFCCAFSLKAQVLTSVAQTGTFFSNPVIPNDAPDPSVMYGDDGYYYLFATGGGVYRSQNLINWTYRRFAFAVQPTFVKNGGIWALDASKIGDKYVLYFAMSVWGGVDSCGIGVAYSSNPEGPYVFVNAGGKLFYSYELGVKNSIDPFYIQDNGKNYLVWGSFNGIYAIELSDDGLSLKNGAKKVQIAGTSFEGSYIYKHNGYYYYFGSTGSCCSGARSTYRTVYGRSKNLLGPYTNKTGGTMINNQFNVLIQGNYLWAGTGHNAEFVEDRIGQTWILYHAYSKAQPEKGRMVLLDRVLWKNDWPYVVGTQPSSQSSKPKL
jgi:arabinan endo-1,5-alpha-L-arabinosidase